jgi:hypothetical protein
MKRIILLSVFFLLANLSDAIWAGAPPPPTPCDSTGGARLNQTEIANAVQGKLVCAVSTTNKNTWSEEHLAGGQLFEYAKGPSDKVDPRRLAGTWSIVGQGTNATIQYNYGTGGTYTRGLWSSDGVNYSFCNGATVIATATIKTIPGSGPNPC